ncbi:hypothetical protein [Paenibacillus sp. RC67]|uniref:TolB family protein n=1 Tax=Paenibacillus sp. RC67 TaxID=3039392 RepID=UPI0024ACB434|nr:hypothetical protein [Paenibacillus sp. RC67]
MDDSRIEQSLRTLKDRIPVNEELKQRLKQELVKPRKRFALRKWGIFAAAAALLIGVGVFTLQGPTGIHSVSAQSLQVQNQISFVDIGSGSPLDFSEYKDTIYIPIAGKGLFAYDSQGFHQLLKREVSSAKINSNGKQLIIAADGSLAVYDLSSKQYREVLRSQNDTYYEQPSWKDDHTILYVKRVTEPAGDHGFTFKESGIYELNLTNLQSKKLGEGSAPSYANKENAIVFEKRVGDEPQIVRKELKGGEETVIDNGRFPSVSPGGEYIAYVKTEENNRELKPGASVQERVDQVWIADLNGQTKRSITYNTPSKLVSEQEWLNNLEPVDVPQMLVHSGLFSYYNPVWSTKSDSLYVLKDRNNEGQGMSVMRIDLSSKSLQTEEVVRAFNQAAILRDDLFLRSLLAGNQKWVTTSNPQQVSFSIIGSGTEDNKPYVDVEQNRAYTANPDYSVGYTRYYLIPSNKGYLIDHMDNMPGGIDTLVGEQRDGTIAIEGTNTKQETLFSNASIPEKLRPAGKFRIASLAYLTKQKQVVFTLQALQDPSQHQRSSVKVIKYDLGSKSFEEIADIQAIAGWSNVAVESLIVSPDGRYAALDLLSDDESSAGSHVLLLDMVKKASIPLEERIVDTAIEGTHTYYWEGSKLHFMLSSSGQKLHYVWNASTKTIGRP